MVFKVIHAKRSTDSRIRCLPKKKLGNWPKWVLMRNGEMKLERIESKRDVNKTKKKKRKLKQMIIHITGLIFYSTKIIAWISVESSEKNDQTKQILIGWKILSTMNSTLELFGMRPQFYRVVDFIFGLKLPSNYHVGFFSVSRDLFRNIKMAATDKSLEERVKARTSANQKTSAALDKNWTKR